MTIETMTSTTTTTARAVPLMQTTWSLAHSCRRRCVPARLRRRRALDSRFATMTTAAAAIA
jgi:hypothetical protein